MPVYNSEKFIRNAIESLLSQTFGDFELVISDNASTDSTLIICQDYAIRDNRVHCIHQMKNMGAVWNYNFVLQNAKSKYFMWAAADDIWEPTFIEKNILNLENNSNLVASISEIQFYFEEKLNLSSIEVPKKYEMVHPITGTYEQRVEFLFNFNRPQCFYAIYRTDALQSKIIHKAFGSWDYAVILNALKHGEIGVINELLFYMYRGHKKPNSKISLVESMKVMESQNMQDLGLTGIYFPFLPLTIWCMKNLGLKIILKNLVRFIKMNYRAERLILLDLLQKKI